MVPDQSKKISKSLTVYYQVKQISQWFKYLQFTVFKFIQLRMWAINSSPSTQTLA